MYHIYTLSDPRDASIRYVGMSQNAYKRYAMHLMNRSGMDNAKQNWIGELLQAGLGPTLNIVETVETKEKTEKREAYWIQYHLNLGAPLLNVSKNNLTRNQKHVSFLPPRKPIGISLAEVQMDLIPPNVRFLNLDTVALVLGRPKAKIRKWILQRSLIAYDIGGWKVKPEDLEKFIESRRNIQG